MYVNFRIISYKYIKLIDISKIMLFFLSCFYISFYNIENIWN